MPAERDAAGEIGQEHVSHPLTVADLIEALSALVERDPKFASWAVHILDMDDDPHGPDRPWDGLVTHVETDAMSHEQGWVVSLTAWRNRGEGHGGKSVDTWDHQPIPWPDEVVRQRRDGTIVTASPRSLPEPGLSSREIALLGAAVFALSLSGCVAGFWLASKVWPA